MPPTIQRLPIPVIQRGVNYSSGLEKPRPDCPNVIPPSFLALGQLPQVSRTKTPVIVSTGRQIWYHAALLLCFLPLVPFEQCTDRYTSCLLYTSPSPRDGLLSRMPSSA